MPQPEVAYLPQPVIAKTPLGHSKAATTGYGKDATTIESEVSKGDKKGDYLQLSCDLTIASAEAEHFVISGEAIPDNTVGTNETMGTVKRKSAGSTGPFACWHPTFGSIDRLSRIMPA